MFFSLLFSSQYIVSQTHPDQFFKKKIGSDGVLMSYSDICTYLKHLETTSKRIVVRDEGKSTLGNPMILAVISSEKNISNIDHLLCVNQKLSRPDQLNDQEIASLLEEARVCVLITGTLHATEVAAAQMALPFSHFLATTDNPHWLNILDNTILLLMPSINPDGHVMVTDWYNNTKGTPREGSPMPFLYHHYAGHDNNRDYFMLNLAETRVVNAVLHHRYFPHIFLDMHQMGTNGPRMFVPPFKDPINQNLDPLMMREVDTIGSYMALKLQQSGKKGVASAYAFDAYWPGGSKNTAWYKNVVGLLTEMASVNLASPIHIDANELTVHSKGLPEYKAQVNFPDPWPGGWWRLQDIIDYERIAVEGLLEITAQHRRLFLDNYVAMGKSAMNLPRETGIEGYLIPAQHQWDKGNAISLIKKMIEHGLDVYQTQEAMINEKEGVSYEKGDFFITLAQPYGRFIKAMMEIQKYPTVKDGVDGDIVEPYDVSGWTLPMQMGVTYRAINQPISSQALRKIKLSDLKVSNQPMPSPGSYLLSGRENDSWKLVNALLKQQSSPLPIRVVKDSETAQAGDFIIQGTQSQMNFISKLASEHNLDLTPVEDKTLQTKAMKRQRIGLYQSALPNMDEGWTRWVLDHFGFNYQSLKNEAFNSKNLFSAWDVIILPNMSRDAIIKGYSQDRYQTDADTIPVSYRNGIGEVGISKLLDFVKNGKTLILLDSSWEIARQDFKLPIRNQLDGISEKHLFIPGSLLKINIDNQDPLAWGMPQESILYFSNSPAFRTTPTGSQHIKRYAVARFSDCGPHLLSGYAKGESHLDRGLTALRFQVGQGQLVVFAGRVQHRSQTSATFKMLFNAIFL